MSTNFRTEVETENQSSLRFTPPVCRKGSPYEPEYFVCEAGDDYEPDELDMLSMCLIEASSNAQNEQEKSSMFGDIFHALTIIWTSLITILFSCIGQQHATRGSAQQQENEHEAHSTFNTYLFIVLVFVPLFSFVGLMLSFIVVPFVIVGRLLLSLNLFGRGSNSDAKERHESGESTSSFPRPICRKHSNALRRCPGPGDSSPRKIPQQHQYSHFAGGGTPADD